MNDKIKNVHQIREALKNFDGDKRGLLSVLAAAEEAMDNEAVDRFAKAMKEKLALSRAKGRGGWDDPEQCNIGFLQVLLREHLQKGDPVDVANLCMMLYHRGGRT